MYLKSLSPTDASYQVWLKLAPWFLRCFHEKVDRRTDGRCAMP